MKAFRLMRGVLLLGVTVCMALVAWEFIQTGALPDPTAAVREFGVSIQENLHDVFQGVLR